MAATNKNSYETKHDEVILSALRESPNNRNEAFRQAKKMLKDKFDFDATPNQISSRFYTFIKPKILDRLDNDNEHEVKNRLVASAGQAGGPLSPSYSKRFDIIRELAIKLPSEQRLSLARELLLLDGE